MHSTEYLRLLRSIPGVVRVELAPADLVQSVAEMEASITRGVGGGMRISNSGMVQCMDRDMIAVIFCDSDFKRPDQVTMRMVNPEGVVVGHDVPPSRMEEFKARDDISWIASTFVMYPDLIGNDDATMVMGSSSLTVAGAPEESAAEMFFPSCSSADMINSRFAMDNKGISNAIVGVDGIEVDVDAGFNMFGSVSERAVGSVIDRNE